MNVFTDFHGNSYCTCSDMVCQSDRSGGMPKRKTNLWQQAHFQWIQLFLNGAVLHRCFVLWAQHFPWSINEVLCNVSACSFKEKNSRINNFLRRKSWWDEIIPVGQDTEADASSAETQTTKCMNSWLIVSLPRKICDPVMTFSSQTTSCSVLQTFVKFSELQDSRVQDYVLWDARIIQEVRNKNKPERSHQSNTQHVHVRSLWWRSAWGAQCIQTVPWTLTFPTEFIWCHRDKNLLNIIPVGRHG